MYPAILPLWPSLGRLLLGTRRRTMDAAAQNAKLNKHQGLQFPWESALTGKFILCLLFLFSLKGVCFMIVYIILIVFYAYFLTMNGTY